MLDVKNKQSDQNLLEESMNNYQKMRNFDDAYANDVIKSTQPPPTNTTFRPLVRRQTTRFGLTSDESILSSAMQQNLEDCLDDFLIRCVCPLVAVMVILYVFAGLETVTGSATKITNATSFFGLLILMMWVVCKYCR